MFNSHVAYMAGVRKRRGREMRARHRARGRRGTFLSFLPHAPKFPLPLLLPLLMPATQATLTWDAISRNGQQQGYVRVHSHPIPQESPVKIAFGDSCYRILISRSRSFGNFRSSEKKQT